MIRVSCQYAYQIYAYHTKIENTRMYTSYKHAYVFHIYERAYTYAIITYAYPVLNQIRAYHYAYIRFSILERRILQANIDIPRILIYACIPYFYLNYVYKAIIKFMKT